MKCVLGLGCDRHTSAKSIEAAIGEALLSVDLCVEDVTGAASIDKKSDEAGLLAVCQEKSWQIIFYPAETLAKVATPNPSDVVMRYVGTPSVSEAAAILCAGGTMDDLLLEKYKYKDTDGKHVTVSVVRVQDA